MLIEKDLKAACNCLQAAFVWFKFKTQNSKE